MFKHLLVPLDGSQLSDLAVDRAISFAKEASAQITFFFAKPDYPIAFYGEGALIDPATPEQFAEMAEAQAQEILRAAQTKAQSQGVTSSVLSLTNSAPWEGIVSAAQQVGADLIFMASRVGTCQDFSGLTLKITYAKKGAEVR